MRADGKNSVLVKAWNYSTWPAYKSRFWNKEAGAGTGTPPVSQPQSRTTSYVSSVCFPEILVWGVVS